MQLFVNNWAGRLLTAVSAGDLAIHVEPALAARLVGLGAGDFYQVTVALKDSDGEEFAWEVMKVTGVSGEVLTVVRAQDGTTAIPALPAGTDVSARLTAGAMAAQAAAIKSLSDQIAGISGGGLTKSNFVGKLLDCASGKPGNIGYFDADVGELLVFDPILEFPGLGTAAPVNPTPGSETFYFRNFGLLIVYGPGAGVNLASDFVLNTGTSSDGFSELRVKPAAEAWPPVLTALGAPTSQEVFSLDSSIATMALGVIAGVPTLSAGGNSYTVYLSFTLPNLNFNITYDANYYGSNWNIGYSNSEGAYLEVDSGLSVTAGRLYAFTVTVAEVGGAFVVSIKEGDNQLLSVPVADLQPTDPARLGVSAQILKSEGSTNRQLRLYRVFGKVTLK